MNLNVVCNDIDHFNMLVDLGIENLIVASNYSSYRKGFDIAKIKQCLLKRSNLIVSFYDLISESKIDEVTNYIDDLILLGVKNFIVNDSGLVYYLCNKNVSVILDNITLTSNYETVSVWQQFGINKLALGREITLQEINNICEKSSSEIYVHIQGSFPIFTSIRKLLTNYQDAKKITELGKHISLFDKDRNSSYKIIENKSGVVMFSSYEQCSIEELTKIKTVNFIIDQPNVNNETSVEIVKMYLDFSNYNLEDIQKISELKQSKGFLYKRTLYKL